MRAAAKRAENSQLLELSLNAPFFWRDLARPIIADQRKTMTPAWLTYVGAITGIVGTVSVTTSRGSRMTAQRSPSRQRDHVGSGRMNWMTAVVSTPMRWAL
jgi:hypothetical protein